MSLIRRMRLSCKCWLRKMERFEEIGNVGESRTLRVSASGRGLYLYLPKELVEMHGILAGDRIEVKLGKIHRPKRTVRGEQEGE